MTGTLRGSQVPCQPGPLQNATRPGMECVGKKHAVSDTLSGSDGGSQVRTLTDSRSPEKKVEELLALVEQGPQPGPDEAVESDAVCRFLDEHGLVPGFTYGVTMADLYRMYEDWTRGVDLLIPKVFVRRVKGAGFRRAGWQAPGKTSYAVLMGKEGAQVCRAWAKEHPAEFGYGLKFRQRMLKGGK